MRLPHEASLKKRVMRAGIIGVAGGLLAGMVGVTSCQWPSDRAHCAPNSEAALNLFHVEASR